jgi:hypothetical protein
VQLVAATIVAVDATMMVVRESFMVDGSWWLVVMLMWM